MRDELVTKIVGIQVDAITKGAEHAEHPEELADQIISIIENAPVDGWVVWECELLFPWNITECVPYECEHAEQVNVDLRCRKKRPALLHEIKSGLAVREG